MMELPHAPKLHVAARRLRECFTDGFRMELLRGAECIPPPERMRHVLETILAILARAVLRRQRPHVVGVTGSVGKTSTREAITAVLAVSHRVRSAPKNFNNEIGLPIAVLSGVPPGRSSVRWLAMLVEGCRLVLVRSRAYPEVLVLEYGADHLGDLARLTHIAPPSVGVITAVGPAHTAFFGSVERVVAEKRRLVTALPRDGLAVLNRDDAEVFAMRDRTRARILTYGFHPEADIHGIEFQVTMDAGIPTGIALKVSHGGSAVPVHLLGCLGRGHASAALAAVAVGVGFGMHLVEISHALERYVGPPGRMRILSGVKRTVLIDDSYNASPLALAVALETLRDMPVSGRKFAVLGDMLELGALTEHAHRHAGELAATAGLAFLVVVGEASRHVAAGARDAGMAAEHVLEFHTALEAGRFIQNLLQSGDVVLVKGSQGMRMERIVKELMGEPPRAPALLCRQDDEWLTRA